MRNLLRPPQPDCRQDLARAVRVIVESTPLSPAHRRDLPQAVRDLSRMLTSERDLADQPYWSSPRLLTAYCRYFLPWNLHRLAWLLPGLRLPLAPKQRAPGTSPEEVVILDLGSGPLTLPLALWVACPEFRRLPLRFICVDVAPHPMNVGRTIFQALAGETLWRFELRRGPLEAALGAFKGKVRLILAGNVLNELPPPRRGSLQERMEGLARLLASRLEADGRVLSVEPGTRLGGRVIAALRQAALEQGLTPEAPCPHAGPCPMLGPRATGWCHFSMLTTGAPPELLGLTRRAALEKRSLSLSCLLLRPMMPEEETGPEAELAANPLDFLESEVDAWLDSEGGPEDGETVEEDIFEDGQRCGLGEERARPASGVSPIRILSDPITIPGKEESARYACTERGLAVVHGAGRMPSGAGFAARWPETDSRDPKTGALEITLVGKVGKRLERGRPAATFPRRKESFFDACCEDRPPSGKEGGAPETQRGARPPRTDRAGSGRSARRAAPDRARRPRRSKDSSGQR